MPALPVSGAATAAPLAPASALPSAAGRRLGEVLLEAGLVSEGDLNLALQTQRARGGRLGALLVRLGAITEDSLYPVLARQLDVPLIRLGTADDASCRQMLEELGPDAPALLRCGVVPWRGAGHEVHLVCADPLSPEIHEAIDELPALRAAVWGLGFPEEVQRSLERLKAEPTPAAAVDSRTLREMADDAPIIALVNGLVAQAVESRASDIHLEPAELELEVRFRVDGVLQVRTAIPMSRYPAVASRIKLIAGIDIAERRLPQDGRISMRAAGAEVEIRVSTVPAVHGESIVMRLLPKRRADLSLDSLGMSLAQLEEFRRWLQFPNGLVLVTGPTGSGKSTSLYAALAATNDRSRKILTVEDPVEYRLDHVIQVQAQPDIGYGFARALRAFLRHDPDVIMVGEIRDRETAEIAIQSALTGHLVLSTLHTNDAPSAVTRLVDMGVEPFLVVASLRAVMAQRLARRLCEVCSVPAEAPANWPGSQGLAPAVAPRFRRPVGCASCQGTGFKGRVGIYSMFPLRDEAQRAILAGVPATELGALGAAYGYRTLAQEGWEKVQAGVTTVDEVLRAIGTLD